VPDVSFKDLCIDVTAGEGRPEAVAAFWSAALGQPVKTHDDGGLRLDPPAGGEKNRIVFWVFHSVPEPKTVKNRVHWDVRLVDTTIDGLVMPRTIHDRRISRKPISSGRVVFHVVNVRGPDDVDDVVKGWITEAWEAAS
jgi:hypothetical protein